MAVSTRKPFHSSSNSPFYGAYKRIFLVLMVGLLSLLHQCIQPPPPSVCGGSTNGPAVTSTRIKLKDGRHLAYMEHGVPKEEAKHKIVYVHGFDSCRYDALRISEEVIEEQGIYLVSFDRPGYGESDPHPAKTVESTATDIEELTDQLNLGSKFYVIGFSMGGELVWGCIKYIPHRLAGAAILAPVANYWWDGYPRNVSKEAYAKQLLQDQWAVRVAHYAPWLTYWWNTQKRFPCSSVISLRFDIFSTEDMKLMPKFAARSTYAAQVRQQGEFESVHRDLMIGFGRWEFSPMSLSNPFRENNGSVHLWHGAQDRIVPVALASNVAQKLPWIRYHELPEAGHFFPFADGMADAIVKSLLLGDS